jgi:hypothetical protein
MSHRLQKDMTPAARKASANRRFTYKFNFVLDTEDAMVCCRRRCKLQPWERRRARERHLARFNEWAYKKQTRSPLEHVAVAPAPQPPVPMQAHAMHPHPMLGFPSVVP